MVIPVIRVNRKVDVIDPEFYFVGGTLTFLREASQRLRAHESIGNRRHRYRARSGLGGSRVILPASDLVYQDAYQGLMEALPRQHQWDRKG
jgi:hypothetical protein